MCVYEGDLDWQWKSGCLAVPVVEAGCRRWRVLSRQYEAYVRDQCWTVEITEMRREEGLRELRETEITGGLVPWPQAEWLLITCKHTHIHISLIASSSQAVDTHAQPSRGCVQSPVLIRLSSSPGGSVHSFVSRIMTRGIRAWLLNLFKLLSVCNWRKTEWWGLKSRPCRCVGFPWLIPWLDHIEFLTQTWEIKTLFSM